MFGSQIITRVNCIAPKLNLQDVLETVYKHIGSVDKQDIARLDERINADVESNSKAFEEIEKLLTTEKSRELFERVKISRTEFAKSREQVMDLSRYATNNAHTYNLARTELEPVCDKYMSDIDGLIIYSQTEANAATKGIQSAVQASQYGILIGLSMALVVGIGVAFTTTRSVNMILHRVSNTLNEGSSQVVSAASQVASGSQNLAEGASEQAASLEETSSSLEEMSSMSKQNAECAKRAKELANNTKSAAEEGSNYVRIMNQSMDRIQASSDEMRNAMGAVKGSNNEVSKIIKTIDEIAFQTNILALNAAVEAARAGEAGMGFAVVADEVRNLAQKSAMAAKETAGKIELAISRTEVGVRVSEKVLDDLKTVFEQSRQIELSLKGIEDKSREVDGLVGEIAAASSEQSLGIEQINTAVNQMDKVTQSNAANAEESASAAEELNAQAVLMTDAVGDLLALIGGKSKEKQQLEELRIRKEGQMKKVVRRPYSAGTKSGSHTLVRPPIISHLPMKSGGNGADFPQSGDINSF